MEEDQHLEKLKKVLHARDCNILYQSKVIEITFKKKEDAEWFEHICSSLKGKSAVSCLMSLNPPSKSQYKFIFNIQDMERFLELMDNDTL